MKFFLFRSSQILSDIVMVSKALDEAVVSSSVSSPVYMCNVELFPNSPTLTYSLAVWGRIEYKLRLLQTAS